MKVLHLTDGLSMIPLCEALTRKGMDVTTCHFYKHSSNVSVDICLNLQDVPPNERVNKMTEFLHKAMDEYDLFHFHFGFTFLPDNSDLEILKRKGKKLIVHHHGSEVRSLSIARSFNNPYVEVKPYWTEERIQQNLQRLSQYVDDAIIPYFELLPYIEKYYKNIHYIPNGVDVRSMKAVYPETTCSSPLLIHAPSNRMLKGTEYVTNAVERLRQKGLNFRFALIEKLPHAEAQRLYREADIVIDQLRIGDYGLFSIEAMALGKPVVCFIRDDLRNKYPDLPIVNATPDTVAHVLEDLIKDPEKRRQLGIQSRNYAQKFHDADNAADKLIEIYKNLR
ncbi:glycosyltransferase family 4 protein [Anoxybacteroides tepidamans]|uniref:glycosyltransferase family 4 protein n=1 Tax=Anoxybacteroides tepidamans TaxID=265948 RepID=UPI000484F2F9|nr:glycosyltransferase family 4 protein [Anoxybacillus tepidamans]